MSKKTRTSINLVGSSVAAPAAPTKRKTAAKKAARRSKSRVSRVKGRTASRSGR